MYWLVLAVLVLPFCQACSLFPYHHDATIGKSHVVECRTEGNADNYNFTFGFDENMSDMTEYTDHVNRTLLLLTLPAQLGINSPTQGYVKCAHNRDTEESCLDIVKFGYEPSPVDSRINVSNWDTLIIDLFPKRQGGKQYKTNYTLYYRNSLPDSQYTRCEEMLELSCTISNVMSIITDKGLMFVKVNATNIVGTYEGEVEVLNIFDLAEPAMVQEVKFLGQEPRTTEMCLQPPNVCCANRTMFRIEYKSTFDEEPKELSLFSYNMTLSGVGWLCYNLTDLWQGTSYNVSIQALSLPKYIPGPVLHQNFTSLESVPQRSVTLVKGGFEVVEETASSRQVLVYWQNMDARYQGGVLRSVRVTSVCGDAKNIKVLPYTAQQWVRLELPLDTACIVFIELATERGFNATLERSQTGLTVPNTVVNPRGNVTVLREPSNNLTIFWDFPPMSQIDYVMLYHCAGTVTCKGVVRALRVDSSTGHLTFSPLATHETDRLGVSLVTETGGVSGLRWQWCIYDSQSLPGVPQLTVKSPHRGKMKVMVECQTCSSSQSVGYPYKFNVYYCVKDKCSQGEVHRRSYPGCDLGLVSGLTPGETYEVWVDTVSRAGHSSSNSTHHHLSISGLSSAIIAVIVVVVVVVAVFISFAVHRFYSLIRQCPGWLRKKLSFPVQTLKSTSDVRGRGHGDGLEGHDGELRSHVGGLEGDGPLLQSDDGVRGGGDGARSQVAVSLGPLPPLPCQDPPSADKPQQHTPPARPHTPLACPHTPPALLHTPPVRLHIPPARPHSPPAILPASSTHPSLSTGRILPSLTPDHTELTQCPLPAGDKMVEEEEQDEDGYRPARAVVQPLVSCDECTESPADVFLPDNDSDVDNYSQLTMTMPPMCAEQTPLMAACYEQPNEEEGGEEDGGEEQAWSVKEGRLFLDRPMVIEDLCLSKDTPTLDID